VLLTIGGYNAADQRTGIEARDWRVGKNQKGAGVGGGENLLLGEAVIRRRF